MIQTANILKLEKITLILAWIYSNLKNGKTPCF
jgi:hypothetical protein